MLKSTFPSEFSSAFLEMGTTCGLTCSFWIAGLKIKLIRKASMIHLDLPVIQGSWFRIQFGLEGTLKIISLPCTAQEGEGVGKEDDNFVQGCP